MIRWTTGPDNVKHLFEDYATGRGTSISASLCGLAETGIHESAIDAQRRCRVCAFRASDIIEQLRERRRDLLPIVRAGGTEEDRRALDHLDGRIAHLDPASAEH
jgi:hypothetical protein